MGVLGWKFLWLGHDGVSQLVGIWAAFIDPMWDWWWLQAGFCLSIDCFFNKLLSTIVFSPFLFYMSFYYWPETFLKEQNKVGFFRSSLLIKFLENELEVFKVKSLVLHNILLKLRVIVESGLDRVNKGLGFLKILSKMSLEIDIG